MALLSFKATVSGDLATNPQFVRWLMARMDSMAEAGNEQAIREHNIEIANWNHRPNFDVRSMLDFSRLLAARETRVTGPYAERWVNINYGGPPVVINLTGTGRKMRFPFQGRGNSYKAKSDGGKGERLGPYFITEQVGMSSYGPRQIRARNFIGNVKSRQANIFSVMEKALRGE